MSARDDMHRHFTEISPVYRTVRTTDREPVEWIARELDGLARPKGADIGCGAGRYVLLMFEMIPNLSLTCVDTTPAMLEQVDGLLRANGIDEFETRQSTAECLELVSGGYDFVSSFNAVHHFDFPEFLRRSRDGLAKDDGCSSIRGCPSTMRAVSGDGISRVLWKGRRDCWRSGISTGRSRIPRGSDSPLRHV